MTECSVVSYVSRDAWEEIRPQNGFAETDNRLLGIQCDTPKSIQGTLSALCTIWLLKDGPRRGDISTRYYLANTTEKSLRYYFNCPGIGCSLLQLSTKCIQLNIGVPCTSGLAAINATRMSNNNLAYRETCKAIDMNNKNKARTWKA